MLSDWLSYRNIFRGGGGKIYCYANFFCYAIVFGPNFREGQKFSGGKLPQGGAPAPTVEESQSDGTMRRWCLAKVPHCVCYRGLGLYPA